MTPPDTGARDQSVAQAMTPAADPRPSLYFAHPLLLGAVATWPRHLARIAAMGFGAVVLAPPFRPGRFGHVYLTADHDQLHPALEQPDARHGLAAITEVARAEGLDVLLDLSLHRLAADAPLVAANPDWFAPALSLDPPDPRIPPERANAALFRPEAFDAGALDWWAGRVESWLDAGIAGLRCTDAHLIPSHVWTALIHRLRAHHRPWLVASALGAPEAALRALGGCGFDFAASSSCYWDFRAGWLADDMRAVASVAPALAMAEAPFGPRVSGPIHDRQRARRAAARAAGFAAAYGAAWMVPMGFEYGAREGLDPIRATPGDLARMVADAPFDLSDEIAALNTARARDAARPPEAAPTIVSTPDDTVAVLMQPEAGGRTRLVAVNAALDLPAAFTPARLSPIGRAAFAAQAGEAAPVALPPAGLLVLDAPVASPILRRRPAGDAAVVAAAHAPRIAIEAVSPAVDDGRFPAKRRVGETVTVTADIICDGHDQLAVALRWCAADETQWHEARMVNLGNDRWRGEFPPSRIGRYVFAIEAWRDAFATFTHELHAKHAAGVKIDLELEEGRLLVLGAAAHAPAETAAEHLSLAQGLRDAAPDARLATLLGPRMATLMALADDRPFASRTQLDYPVDAERIAAGFASWYELFPRSMTTDPNRHGTFLDVIDRLPAIRDMGFDVLYFPPIHPIGRVNRKGRNNSLTPGPDDHGSPYAIGSEEGGHDAIHPKLGTLDDFRTLRDAAARHGLELALDFAVQCAPDHPWLREHPEWFAFRADGSLRYAENPPKKYEDITNVDFYAPGAIPALWQALRDVVLFWAGEGVMNFRVDNPHTKPLPFWEWMIAEVRAQYPQASFLAEAFTRPKVMYRLAKVGFSQSYTYFTWRNTKRELSDYITEIAAPPVSDFFRPHFFVNTPDINPLFLQSAGRPGFLIRAALAATMSGLWGVYSGFELCEAQALPGREEYLDSEKYQIRVWDWDRPGNIVAEIARLNRIRRDNPALQTHTGITIETAYNDNILYFEKATAGRENVILVAVNLDPHNAQEADIEIPLWRWSLPDDATVQVRDLMRETDFTWRGKYQHIRLDPANQPFAIWRVRPAG